MLNEQKCYFGIKLRMTDAIVLASAGERPAVGSSKRSSVDWRSMPKRPQFDAVPLGEILNNLILPICHPISLGPLPPSRKIRDKMKEALASKTSYFSVHLGKDEILQNCQRRKKGGDLKGPADAQVGRR